MHFLTVMQATQVFLASRSWGRGRGWVVDGMVWLCVPQVVHTCVKYSMVHTQQHYTAVAHAWHRPLAQQL
jgi:hypothetical protein